MKKSKRHRWYSQKVKADIMYAVREVRKAGGSWKNAHNAAVKAGYGGTIGGLTQMVRGIQDKQAQKIKFFKQKVEMVVNVSPLQAPAEPMSQIHDEIEQIIQARVIEHVSEVLETFRETLLTAFDTLARPLAPSKHAAN